jgi:ferritin-like metal-binding protein YciE
MKLNNLEELFVDQIKDLYSAENLLLKALPKLAKAASSKELKEALQNHTEETRNQVARLESIAESCGISVRGKKCKAMEGLIEEGKELLEADGAQEVIDAGIIAACQRVEHYEIAAYGTARAYAELLGHEEAVEMLQETLDEESAADELLNEIAEGSVNEAAYRVAEEGEEGEEEEEEEEPAPRRGKGNGRGKETHGRRM